MQADLTMARVAELRTSPQIATRHDMAARSISNETTFREDVAVRFEYICNAIFQKEVRDKPKNAD